MTTPAQLREQAAEKYRQVYDAKAAGDMETARHRGYEAQRLERQADEAERATSPMTELLDATRELKEAVVVRERMRVHTGGNVRQMAPYTTRVMAAEDRLKQLVRDLERAATVAAL